MSRVSDNIFRITGGTDPHLVNYETHSQNCDCKDFDKGHRCKHLFAVAMHIGELTESHMEPKSGKATDDALDVYQLWHSDESHKVREQRVAA